jgi:ferritin
MQVIYSFAIIISLFSIASTSSSSIELDDTLGECLSDLATQELSVSYNYLDLSSKFGTNKAYPGFSSLFVKISDDDSSKGHDLVKFLALRKATLKRLINNNGITISNNLTGTYGIFDGLKEARHHNKHLWDKVVSCHKAADEVKDANVQDYLESNLLNHHIEINKLLADLEHRIIDAQNSESDRSLIIFMMDEELLQTYGDRRKDIFS